MVETTGPRSCVCCIGELGGLGSVTGISAMDIARACAEGSSGRGWGTCSPPGSEFILGGIPLILPG